MQTVLRWISGSKRPLRLEELEEAVALSSTDSSLPTHRIARNAGRKLVSDCGNLVMYNEEDDTVTFAHPTVQQYLRNIPSAHQVAPLLPKFDSVSIDEFIGSICLAYLSFADFETQLTKPLTMDRKTVQGLIWWGIPFGSVIPNAISLIQSRQQKWHSISTSPITLFIPGNFKPSSQLTQNFVLLEYVTDHWAFHTAEFTKDSIHWPMLQAVVLGRQNLFEFRPWHASSHYAQLNAAVAQKFGGEDFPYGDTIDRDFHPWFEASQEIMLLYSWAMAHGVGSLLTILSPSDLLPYLRLNGSDRVFKSFLELLSTERLAPGSVHHGFWSGELLYRTTHSQSQGDSSLLEFCCTEFDRWNGNSSLTFDVYLQEAILLSLRHNDGHALDILFQRCVHTWDGMVSLLVRIVLGNEIRQTAIRKVLRIDLMTHQATPQTDLELFFALQNCVPMVEAMMQQHSNEFLQLDYKLGYLLLIAALTSGHCICTTRIVRILGPYIQSGFSVTQSDWASTALGTSESHARLQAFQRVELSSWQERFNAAEALVAEFYLLDRSIIRAQNSLCSCQLRFLDVILQLQWNIGVASRMSPRSITLLGCEYLKCLVHSQRVGMLLNWALHGSSSVWDAVSNLPYPELDLQNFCQTGMAPPSSTLACARYTSLRTRVCGAQIP